MALVRLIAMSTVEFVILLLLWMLFVSQLSWQEFWIGFIAAALATLADTMVEAENFAPFQPRMRWVLLIFWEPWYVLKGSIVALRELARTLTGGQPVGRFQAFSYPSGGQDAVAGARRALFAAYVTISPDTIVVGIDRDHNTALLHQIGPTEVSELARELGARP